MSTCCWVLVGIVVLVILGIPLLEKWYWWLERRLP
jgi:hypothetical protein